MTQNKLVLVMTALCCDPWLITPEMHKVLTDIAKNHAEGGTAEDVQHALAAKMDEKEKTKEYEVVGNVAVIPVEGVIAKKFSNVLRSSGVTSVDILEKLIIKAVDDRTVDCIMLNFDTPGGTVRGVPEAAVTIRAARETKPIMAFADGMMCSAGYWLAAQANVIYASASSDVGSIGVYQPFLDQSRFAEMQGLRVEMFKSGRNKGAGYPGTSLTDEQRQIIQDRVNTIGIQFRQAVRAGRAGVEVSDEDMQGQSFDAETALARKLIDSITTFDVAMRDATIIGKNYRAKGTTK